MSLDEHTFEFGDRRYRVRGLDRNSTFERLHVNVLVRRGDEEDFHLDTLDLYSARQRSSFLRQASAELDVPETALKRDLGRLLLALEEVQTERFHQPLDAGGADVVMTPEARTEALEWLTQPGLLKALAADIAMAGLVGESDNAVLAYLAATSRKLADPLAVLIQSSSAAGKSSLMDAILDLIPPEDVLRFSALTPQTLYYLNPHALQNRILALAEEEGAAGASYALKLLQSDKGLTLATTEKDKSGRSRTQTYRVEGPVSLFMTTTATRLDPELMNRCLVLAVDEGPEQTARIHARQRAQETLEGLKLNMAKAEVIARHHAIQRVLEPVTVINPLAEKLTFDARRTRSRRDHKKLLTLIRAVAFLHQHQRPQKTEGDIAFIEATNADVEAATALLGPVLAQGHDDLAPQARRLLEGLRAAIETAVTEQALEPAEVHFTRRQARGWTGFSADQVRHHLHRLVDLELVRVVSVGRVRAVTYALEPWGLERATLRGGWDFGIPGSIDNDSSVLAAGVGINGGKP